METLKVNGYIKINPQSSRSYLHNPNRWMLFMFGNKEWFKYYHWLIQRRFGVTLNQPENPPHITLITGEDINSETWNFACKWVKSNTFKDVELLIQHLNTNGKYWWIPVRSSSFENFRTRLGLNARPYWNFHFTIGRASNKHLNQSNYAYQILKNYD